MFNYVKNYDAQCFPIQCFSKKWDFIVSNAEILICPKIRFYSFFNWNKIIQKKDLLLDLWTMNLSCVLLMRAECSDLKNPFEKFCLVKKRLYNSARLRKQTFVKEAYRLIPLFLIVLYSLLYLSKTLEVSYFDTVG